MNLNGHTVLITGGTSGIGLSLVNAFHARGAVVRFCARSEPAVREVERAHSGSTGYVCDVTNSDGVKATLGSLPASVMTAPP